MTVYMVTMDAKPLRFYPLASTRNFGVNKAFPTKFRSPGEARRIMQQRGCKGAKFVIKPHRAPKRKPAPKRVAAHYKTKHCTTRRDIKPEYGKYLAWMSCDDCGGRTKPAGGTY